MSVVKDLFIASMAAIFLVLVATAVPALAHERDVCEGYEDASWCGGDSVIECADGTTAPESTGCPTDSCEMMERSARGYCPGEPGHEEERCGTIEMAGEECLPSNGDVCEEDGTCDDSCPHRSDCLADPSPGETATESPSPIRPATETPIEPAESPGERLPETGAGMVGLIALGLSLLAGGGRLLKLTR